jgi:hypothetical protein
MIVLSWHYDTIMLLWLNVYWTKVSINRIITITTV